MSTQVTVSVAKPNHLPVNVYIEDKVGCQWQPVDQPKTIVRLEVGQAETFLVYGSRRIIIEEVIEAR
jgi:hypothetical protein